jgi:hypothetical protein
MVRAGETAARRFNHYLLFCTAVVWLCYGLALVPLPTGPEFVRGLLRACFVCALVWGTVTADLALYGAVRYRYGGYFATGALVVPLALLCWYHAFHWPVPGSGRF